MRAAQHAVYSESPEFGLGLARGGRVGQSWAGSVVVFRVCTTKRGFMVLGSSVPTYFLYETCILSLNFLFFFGLYLFHKEAVNHDNHTKSDGVSGSEGVFLAWGA